tara:strand:+ start:513 stop:2378 length:1866 start_codon:yes stop_codon:yes gene_type:complete
MKVSYKKQSKYSVLRHIVGDEIIGEILSYKDRVYVREMLEHLYREKYLLPTASENFANFCRYVIKDERPNPETGLTQQIELQEFQEVWCQSVQNYDKTLIFSPRETGKSTILCVAYPLWILGNNPTFSLAIVSKSSGQAETSLRGIKNAIEGSKELHRVFPHLRPKSSHVTPNKRDRWTNQEIIVEREIDSRMPSVLSIGLGSRSILGKRFDVLLMDDVLAYGKEITEKEIELGIELYENVLTQCVVEHGGRQVCVGTCWSSKDLLHYLERLPEWDSHRFSFEKEDEQEGYIWVNWPERHSRKKLDTEARNNPAAYARNRRCKVASVEELIFSDKNAIDWCVKNDWKVIDTEKWDKFIGMDLAPKRKRKGTAIVVIAVSPDYQKMIVLDLELGNWSAKEKAQKIQDYCALYNPELFIVEDNSTQQDVVELLLETGLRHLPIDTYTTDGSKEGNIERLSLEMKNGLWRFNLTSHAKEYLIGDRVDYNEADRWCLFTKQVKNYTHDTSADIDGIMAWMFAAEKAREFYGGGDIFTILDINDEAGEKRLMEGAKKLYTLSDYVPENLISFKHGFKWEDRYYPIVAFIQRNHSADVEDTNYSPEDFKVVKDDMIFFMNMMNREAA